MIPIDQVRDIKWLANDKAEDYEPCDWKAVLTTADKKETETNSEEDVRLIWAIFGYCVGSWFYDNDINYNKNNDD